MSNLEPEQHREGEREQDKIGEKNVNGCNNHRDCLLSYGTSSSRMKMMKDKYVDYLRKIDTLEEKFNRMIQLKRRRALLLLEMIPTYRKSHARLFVSHEMNSSSSSNNNNNNNTCSSSNKWTLTLEGRLLIGPLDYQSASLMDHHHLTTTTTTTTSQNPTVITCSSDNKNNNVTTDKQKDAEECVHLNPLGFTMEMIKSSSSHFNYKSNAKTTSSHDNPVLSIRGTENTMNDASMTATTTATNNNISNNNNNNNNTAAMNARKFTHLWDNVAIGFQSFHRTNSSVMQDGQYNQYQTDGKVTMLEWQRDILDPSSLDHFAFQAIHHTPTAPSPMNYNNNNNDDVMVVATISLYKRSPLSTSFPFSSEDLSSMTPTTTTSHTNNSNAAAASTMSLSSSYSNTVTGSRNNMMTTMDNMQEILYIPSHLLCKTLFPSHLSSLEQWNRLVLQQDEEEYGQSNSNHVKKKKKNNHPLKQQNSSSTSSSLFVPPQYNQPPLNNDIVILPMITIHEVLMALNLYIQEHDLLVLDTDNDHNTLSGGGSQLVKNDRVLKQLFGCSNMNLHEMNRLLLSRQLLLKKKKHQPHIIITHIMTPDNAIQPPATTTATQQNHNNDNKAPIIPTTPTAEETTTFMNEKNNDQNNGKDSLSSTDAVKKRKRNRVMGNENDSGGSTEMRQPNIFSCDVDMELPNVFHERIRELLKRIKRREFEYTSCRSKAIKSFHPSSTATIKMAMEDALSGCGYTVEHIPIFMALAKNCSPNSEAKKSAHIDARIAYLLDQLQQSSQKRKYYQTIVHACLGQNMDLLSS